MEIGADDDPDIHVALQVRALTDVLIGHVKDLGQHHQRVGLARVIHNDGAWIVGAVRRAKLDHREALVPQIVGRLGCQVLAGCAVLHHDPGPFVLQGGGHLRLTLRLGLGLGLRLSYQCRIRRRGRWRPDRFGRAEHVVHHRADLLANRQQHLRAGVGLVVHRHIVVDDCALDVITRDLVGQLGQLEDVDQLQVGLHRISHGRP